MQHDILLTQVDNNGYVARPVLWPELAVSGANEEEALAGVRDVLTDFLSKSRIVQIDIPSTDDEQDNPWLRFAGMWKDIPDDQWEAFQESIAAARQAIDQAENLEQYETASIN